MNKRIKELRKKNGMTQKDLAERIGLSQSGISWIEQDGSNVDNSTIKNICREFHVNEKWLRTGEGPEEVLIERDEYTRAVNEIDARDPKAKQAILDYWKLDDDDKELFWKFVERFFTPNSRED